MASRFSQGPRIIPQVQPTPFSELMQPVEYRQQRWDMGQQQMANAREKLANIQVRGEDVDAQRHLIENMNKKLDEAVDRHGGNVDYAIDDIVQTISEERTNPFWNQAQQLYKESESTRQMREQLQAQGRPVYDLGTAQETPLYDVGTDMMREDLRYDVKGYEPTYRPEHEKYFDNIKESFLQDNFEELNKQAKKEGFGPINSMSDFYKYSQEFGIEIPKEYRERAWESYRGSNQGQNEIELELIRNEDLDRNNPEHIKLAESTVKIRFEEAAGEREYKTQRNQLIKGDKNALKAAAMKASAEGKPPVKGFVGPGISMKSKDLGGSEAIKKEAPLYKNFQHDYVKENPAFENIMDSQPLPPEENKELYSFVIGNLDENRAWYKHDKFEKRNINSDIITRVLKEKYPNVEDWLQVSGLTKDYEFYVTDEGVTVGAKGEFGLGRATPFEMELNEFIQIRGEQPLPPEELMNITDKAQKWTEFAQETFKWQDNNKREIDKFHNWLDDESTTISTPEYFRPTNEEMNNTVVNRIKAHIEDSIDEANYEIKGVQIDEDHPFNAENIKSFVGQQFNDGSLVVKYEDPKDGKVKKINIKIKDESMVGSADLFDKVAEVTGNRLASLNRHARVEIPVNEEIQLSNNQKVKIVPTRGGNKIIGLTDESSGNTVKYSDVARAMKNVLGDSSKVSYLNAIVQDIVRTSQGNLNAEDALNVIKSQIKEMEENTGDYIVPENSYYLIPRIITAIDSDASIEDTQ